MDGSTRKGNFAMSGIEEVNERKIFEGLRTDFHIRISTQVRATMLPF